MDGNIDKWADGWTTLKQYSTTPKNSVLLGGGDNDNVWRGRGL